ncbi:MAG TPA: DUF1801 domain-containing protein [Chitinophagaceae bacterium]|jgi:hypothetical protein|nr:DUF1801 domain-containing protein [Chitinophagaceae bacterium]
MSYQKGLKFQSLVQLWDYVPDDQRIIMDVLRQIILENLPGTCVERLAYNVPSYYGKRRICLIWPAAVPGGGFKKGVLLGFGQGYKLQDPRNYLDHGTNKRIFYKIFYSPEEIDEEVIVELLKEAIELDGKK